MSQFKTRSEAKEATLSYTLLAQCFPSAIKSSHARPTGSPWRIQRPASTVPTGHWDVVSLGHSFMRLHEFSLGNYGWFFCKKALQWRLWTSHHSTSQRWHPVTGKQPSIVRRLQRYTAWPCIPRVQEYLSRCSARFVFHYEIHTGDVHKVNGSFG